MSMFNLVKYIRRQKRWSLETFGPGQRTGGISLHIQKELAEIAKEPKSVEEWVDVVILALDGAWRAGHAPADIVEALVRKQEKNFARRWPAPGPQDLPTEHIREGKDS